MKGYDRPIMWREVFVNTEAEDIVEKTNVTTTSS